MKLKDHKLFGVALKAYSIQIGFDYKYVRNNPNRITVLSKKGCG